MKNARIYYYVIDIEKSQREPLRRFSPKYIALKTILLLCVSTVDRKYNNIIHNDNLKLVPIYYTAGIKIININYNIFYAAVQFLVVFFLYIYKEVLTILTGQLPRPPSRTTENVTIFSLMHFSLDIKYNLYVIQTYYDSICVYHLLKF